jgi:hypothetical protein
MNCALSHYSAVLDTIELVDLEIEKHLSAAAIVDLKRRRNTLVPISRLPPEVLGGVLLLVAADSPLGVCHNWARRLTPLLAVCKHWQQVAIAYPKLWSQWDQMETRWLPIFAFRSQKSLIKIELDDIRDPSFLTSWATLFENPELRARVNEMHIDAGSQCIQALLEPFRVPEADDPPYSIHSLDISNSNFGGPVA